MKVEEELARVSLEPSSASTDSETGHSAEELDSSTNWPESQVEEDVIPISLESSPSTTGDSDPLGTLNMEEGSVQIPPSSSSGMNQSAGEWDPLANLTTWPKSNTQTVSRKAKKEKRKQKPKKVIRTTVSLPSTLSTYD